MGSKWNSASPWLDPGLRLVIQEGYHRLLSALSSWCGDTEAEEKGSSHTGDLFALDSCGGVAVYGLG